MVVGQITTDDFHSNFMKSLQNLISSKDPYTKSGYAFALGCLHRSVGATRSMGHLPGTVSALHHLARDDSTVVQSW